MSERRRSFWGWGWADRFPDREARRAIGEQVSAFVRADALEVREPPDPAALRLPAPRIPAPSSLGDLVSTDQLDRAAHTYGRGWRDLFRGFAGDFRHAPDVVLRPSTEAEVAAALDWAEQAGVALVPYGGGTSVVGGVEPDVGDGWRAAASLDLGRLDRVLEVVPESLHARIQAGVLGPSLEAQLAPHGLTLRHYPQSFEFSSLGGWIATRAAGHHATQRTHIEERVAGVRMLTPRGPFETLRGPASGAGPDPMRLVAGSEGTLGVITEAWMRLERRPRWRAKATVRFARFDRAAEAVRALAQSGLQPSNLRLLDRREALLNGVDTGEHDILLVGFESADHPLDAWLHRALELARDHGGEAPEDHVRLTEGDGERGETEAAWREAFLSGPYLLNVLVSLGVVADTFETACPWDRFLELRDGVIHDVREAMQRVAGRGLVTLRLTHVYPDGPAPYFTFAFAGRPGAEAAQHEAVKAAASEAILRHGGTITHHHAVGRLHRPWYARERPEPFGRILQGVKWQLDPRGFLNPGILVDPGHPAGGPS